MNARINDLLKTSSIRSDGVINLFSGVKERGVSLFDPEFLNEISKLKGEGNSQLSYLKNPA